MNLTKYLSSCGVDSRRKCAELIKGGNVAVNGSVVIQPATVVNESDQVAVNGKNVAIPSKVYIMLNKPPGYTCTNADPFATHKAIDLIQLQGKESGIRLFSAGRLDKESEGLLIFTNDGDYVEQLTHPSKEISKEYIVTVNHEITQQKLSELHKGIKDDGEFLKPVSIKLIKPKTYSFILNEGKKREIRRMVRYAETRTVKLRRIAIGQLQMDIAPGKWRHLNSADIKKSLLNP
ncbi:MAG: rRNA pseudouridine synthase [Lentisphaerae bacterium]|nr:rRNA pseudouridine synthase [Lentisphaerota bacterium]MCP4103789.1 rRNA pseudouridine synthase [Lentisphaerota bacterium]